MILGIMQMAKSQTILVMPDSNAVKGQFTEWKSVTVTDAKGVELTYEYRVAWMKRTGIACYYNIEIKNTSKVKLKTVKLTYRYHDKLVNADIVDVKKGSAKIGGTAVFKFIQQGCRKDKGAKDVPDNVACSRCPLEIEVTVGS